MRKITTQSQSNLQNNKMPIKEEGDKSIDDQFLPNLQKKPKSRIYSSSQFYYRPKQKQIDQSWIIAYPIFIKYVMLFIEMSLGCEINLIVV